ncbi:LacI family DNA-binding transcriptional regulator [Paenibacillus gansuensis]|uniref:LacI family DNA-binding transcriptional regulator n=1 Tax=Paenibacillus gansuensis TaxID=306542 RepID=A0ABW5PGM0_9BACL
MKQITVYDIAREAKVSVATVSRVLNNTAPVKTSTRNKVAELIQKYQFQPNALARSLLKKETGMIGIVLPDITNPFFPEVLSGLEQEARKQGYTFFLCDTCSSNSDTREQYRRESHYLHLLLEKQVDGIIILGGRIDLVNPTEEMVQELLEVSKRVPVVQVNGRLSGSSMHRVVVNETAGAEQATQHLIHLGHKDIVMIGGFDHMSNTVARVKGFKKAMKENGLSIGADKVIYGGFSVDDGRRLMDELLCRKKRPSAVFCINDLTAIGAMKAAFKAGLRIPEDLSIVGFDDIPFASHSIPELTSVSLKCNELGRTAAEMMHRLIRKEKVKKQITIEPDIRVRDTTGPFRG